MIGSFVYKLFVLLNDNKFKNNINRFDINKVNIKTTIRVGSDP